MRLGFIHIKYIKSLLIINEKKEKYNMYYNSTNNLIIIHPQFLKWKNLRFGLKTDLYGLKEHSTSTDGIGSNFILEIVISEEVSWVCNK